MMLNKLLFIKFQQIIQNNKLSHLYLIEGGSFYQRKMLVIEIAIKIFNQYCSNDQDENMKKLIQKGHYPNFYYLATDDAFIKKENIVELKRYFSQTSLFCPKRVYVIEEINKITPSAGNSLLNFLENPLNEDTHGFLLTNSYLSILPTILSRCQIFSLGFDQSSYSQNNYFNLKQKGLEPIDCFLISAIEYQKDVSLFIESFYYHNLKKTFLSIITYLQKQEKLRFYFIYCPLLKEKKGWLAHLLNCLLKFFLSLFYQKKAISLLDVDNDFLDNYFINISLKQCNLVFRLIHNLQKKEKYFFSDQDLFFSLLMNLDNLL